jgi:exopolyphosphatase/guanosine-5'-triphosphate,3'-diphosphate pyrophosphatase
MPERRAIIDIGSNTVRLVVYGGPSRAPTVVLNEKVSARLGKDLDRTGMLSEKAMGVALAGLKRFAALLRLLGVDDVQTVATAATRDAANGGQFLDRVRALGLNPRQLSGEEEAHASALGVIGAFPAARGIVADLGGGSLELVRIDDGTIGHGISLPFGTLRLPDLRGSGERRFSTRFDTAVGTSWNEQRQLPLFLVGGSWRAFSRYALHLETQAHESPLDDPHGLELEPEAARRIAATLAREFTLAPVPGIPSSRLTALPDAAALLVQLIRVLEPSALVFSSWGLREGLLYAALDPAIQRHDPLLAGVGGFAQRYGISHAMAETVADWTAPASGPLDEAAEALRRSATMLTLAAQRTEPNLRRDEGLDWALRKRWIGIENRGRAQLAAAMIGNSGATEVPPDVAELASREDIREAIGWGLATRLCRKLCAGAAPAIAGSRIAVSGGKLTLTLHEQTAPLYTDSAARSLRLLADWLGLGAEVKIEAAEVVRSLA